jgi:hypothetical protein
MGGKPDLLEACGEEVGISDAEERFRQGRAGGCVTYSIGICKLMVMSFDVAVIYFRIIIQLSQFEEEYDEPHCRKKELGSYQW